MFIVRITIKLCTPLKKDNYSISIPSGDLWNGCLMAGLLKWLFFFLVKCKCIHNY